MSAPRPEDTVFSLRKPYQLVRSFLQPLIGCSFQDASKWTVRKDWLFFISV